MADVYTAGGGVTATITVVIILTRDTVVSLNRLFFLSYETRNRLNTTLVPSRREIHEALLIFKYLN